MSNCPVTPGHLRQLNTIVSQQRISKETKADLVHGFSGGRCTSSKELYDNEAQLLIKHLQPNWQPPADPGEKMRRNIIAMAHEMGWETPNPLKGAKPKADMDRINAWCERQFGKKKLDAYTYEELPKLVYAFKQVYQHFLKSI